jgi:hypothetical protein
MPVWNVQLCDVRGMQKAPARAGAFMSGICSGFGYFGGLRTLLTLNDFELDLVAFLERAKSIALDCTEVHEDIRSTFSSDKAEALRVTEPLHGP